MLTTCYRLTLLCLSKDCTARPNTWKMQKVIPVCLIALFQLQYIGFIAATALTPSFSSFGFCLEHKLGLILYSFCTETLLGLFRHAEF